MTSVAKVIQNENERTAIAALGLCKHCGLPCRSEHRQNDVAFCCAGCATVYRIIHELGLENFYEYRGNQRVLPSKPAALPDSLPVYLDDPNYLRTVVDENPSGFSEVQLQLDGIHCVACIWLIEKLPCVVRGVREARVNFAQGSVHVTYASTQTQLSAIIYGLAELGYTGRPIARNGVEDGNKTTASVDLVRLGVAAVAAANAMSFSVSLYQGWFSGIPQKYVDLFSWSSLVLSLPSVTFCAMPFYTAAWASIKNFRRTRSLHIDLPISVAIVFAFFMSAANTLRGSHEVYYDTITALIFFLLGARYLQRRTLTRSMSRTDLLSTIVPLSATRVIPSGREVVYSGVVQKGDSLVVEPNALIPVDGEILSGSTKVGTAILTGEANPVEVRAGDCVFAGTKNISDVIVVRASCSLRESRISRIIAQVERTGGHRAAIVELTNRLSGRFVGVMLIASCLCFVLWTHLAGWESGFRHTLSLLVITCPCALGLAAPITMSIAVRRAIQQGIFIRNTDAIERLSVSRHLVFDKTGTITEGVMEVCRVWERKTFSGSLIAQDALAQSTQQNLGIILSLEQDVTHPVAIALKNFAKTEQEYVSLSEKKNVVGKGVQGVDTHGTVWKLGSLHWIEGAHELEDLQDIVQTCAAEHLSPVALSKNDQIQFVFGIGDRARPGVEEFLETQRKRGMVLSLLSGDHSAVVRSIATKIGIEASRALGGQSPESKAEFVVAAEKITPTAFFGDGVNDALALRSAHVGIGVAGGAEIALQVCDVFLAEPNIQAFDRLMSGASRTMHAVWRNLYASAVYNTFGATAAFLGYVNPFVAAVLMPLSSLTVVCIATLSPTFTDEKK